MQDMLTSNDMNCVAVCGHAVHVHREQAMLEDYARFHPVVLISRSTEAVRKHLKIPNLGVTKSMPFISGHVKTRISQLV